LAAAVLDAAAQDVVGVHAPAAHVPDAGQRIFTPPKRLANILNC
jgi:hypothetical protein